jgi:hypothetical protein
MMGFCDRRDGERRTALRVGLADVFLNSGEEF